jgi:uncharacterized membrane protein YbhN (UPF0104 family)
VSHGAATTPRHGVPQEQRVSVPAEKRIASQSGDVARKRAMVRIATVALGFAVLLASVVFVRRQSLDPWSWFAEVWVLIAAIPLPFVVLALTFKATEVSLNAFAWKTVLRAAYPEQQITFRQMLGVVQGGVGIFAVVPPKFGGFAVLGLYRVAFPDLSITAVLATRVVQGISSTILGTVLLVLFGAVTAGIGSGGFVANVVTLYTERTVLAVALTAIVVGLVAAVLRYGREWLRGFVAEMALGGAILRSPRRYMGLVVFPTLLAFVLRWAVTGTLLAAFAIPVSLETLLRVNVSHGIARMVQVTPGGFGTTQAFDLVALRGVASAEVITAYSLSQAAILFVFNIAFGLIALIWALGWERTARLIRRPSRDAEVGPAPAPQPGVG